MVMAITERHQQGGAVPLGHAGAGAGVTMVVCDGGGGLLLLKLKHPPSSSGRNRGR
jgi:hypothetical protein